MPGTRYLTAADLEAVIGEDYLRAAAGDSHGAVDTAAVERAIDEVSARVDARLRAHYDLPLQDVPGFLVRAIARIVHFELCGEGARTDLIESRATAAERLVADLAAGRLRIGGDLDGVPATANSRTLQGRAALVGAPPRQFGRKGTAGLL